MNKKKSSIKDKRLKQYLKQGGRSGAKEDFFSLLKRSAQPLKV